MSNAKYVRGDSVVWQLVSTALKNVTLSYKQIVSVSISTRTIIKDSLDIYHGVDRCKNIVAIWCDLFYPLWLEWFVFAHLTVEVLDGVLEHSSWR